MLYDLAGLVEFVSQLAPGKGLTLNVTVEPNYPFNYDLDIDGYVDNVYAFNTFVIDRKVFPDSCYIVADQGGAGIDKNKAKSKFTLAMTIDTMCQMFFSHNVFDSGTPEHAQLMLGVWIDPDTGKLHLDPVKAYSDDRDAYAIAQLNHQIAIFEAIDKRVLLIKDY